nr:nucleotidyltransferase domain-containing protein [uncultured Oscillibacter sp.]
MMAQYLEKHIEEEISALARRCEIERVFLFGSRARGDCRPRSDIDLAIRGGGTTAFILSVDEAVQTLLLFDVVDLGKPVQPELLAEIERDGVVIYEKV